jgi:hypothetical protein
VSPQLDMRFDGCVISCLATGAITCLVLFAPGSLLGELVLDGQYQPELLRFIGAVVVGWVILELLARYRRLYVPALVRFATITGFGLLLTGLFGPNMTLMFFSFALLATAMVGTAMLLADAWSDGVLTTYKNRRR